MKNSDHSRMDRVNEELKREIAGLIERKSFKDGNCLISITDVSTSEDLRHATVYVSIMGGDENIKDEAIKFLRKNRAEFQKIISKHIIMKYTPVLDFCLDENIERGDRVLAIIRDLEKNDK